MIKIAKILFEFLKICIAFKEKCDFQVSLKVFGFDEETITVMRKTYIRFNDDNSLIKLDPRVSAVFKRDGDEFVNVFQNYN